VFLGKWNSARALISVARARCADSSIDHGRRPTSLSALRNKMREQERLERLWEMYELGLISEEHDSDVSSEDEDEAMVGQFYREDRE